MIQVDTASLDSQSLYKIATGSIVPRPIAFVSTISDDGKPNLAPFSFFTVAAYSPLILVFFPLHFKKGDELKDTTKNLLQNGECVIHAVSEDLIEKVNLASGTYEYGKNEFELSGLTPISSQKVKPFRVKEALIQFECKLHQHLKIGEGVGSSDAFFVEVICAHFDESIFDDFRINPTVLNPVSRLAGVTWGKLGELIDLKRPEI